MLWLHAPHQLWLTREPTAVVCSAQVLASEAQRDAAVNIATGDADALRSAFAAEAERTLALARAKAEATEAVAAALEAKHGDASLRFALAADYVSAGRSSAPAVSHCEPTAHERHHGPGSRSADCGVCEARRALEHSHRPDRCLVGAFGDGARAGGRRLHCQGAHRCERSGREWAKLIGAWTGPGTRYLPGSHAPARRRGRIRAASRIRNCVGSWGGRFNA